MQNKTMTLRENKNLKTMTRKVFLSYKSRSPKSISKDTPHTISNTPHTMKTTSSIIIALLAYGYAGYIDAETERLECETQVKTCKK